MSLNVFRAPALAFAVVLAASGCAAGSPARDTGTAPVDAPAPGTGISDTAAPAAGAPAPSGEVVAAAIDGYRLGNGDRIGIQVFDEPDLTMETQVGASGSINYFYLGDIRVAGKTPQQLERDISSALSNGYLISPSVNVSVVQYRPFFINGEVRSPGGYPYQPGLTLDRAIAIAGGLTDRASTRKMYRIESGSDDNERKSITMSSKVSPGDIISIEEGFF